MQEKNTQNVDFFLKRLKSALNLKSNVELASYLGISTQALSNWKTRNTIDYELVFTKCYISGLNLNWVFSNEGDVFRKDDKSITSSDGIECHYKMMAQEYANLVDRYKVDIDRYLKDIDRLNRKIDELTSQHDPQRKAISA